jgi:ACR3 family arsenite efflux pump ArsB
VNDDEIDFKGIPWYHMLWLIPWICLLVMLYPFLWKMSIGRIKIKKSDLQSHTIVSLTHYI